jgi:hypothetical protein
MAKRISGSVLLLTTLAFALVVGDVLARRVQDPQNQTATPQTQTTPKKNTTSSKRKRGQMKMTTPANETTTGEEPAAATEPAAAAQTTTPAQTTSPTTQTDLSGTYAGTFNCDALGLTGDTTLTVNGNEFSTADGKTGRIVASTTHGYTAVALQTGAVSTAPATPGATETAAPPMIVSMRARKSGNRLTLTSVPGSAMQCSFTPGHNVARRSRRTPAAAGTTVASPAETGPTPAEVTTPATPARTRRGSKKTTTTPTTVPNPTETPAQPTQPAPETPIPTQTPSPEPSPSPMPRPTPSGSPSPEPSPTASPSPMPSPTPSPSPRPRG